MPPAIKGPRRAVVRGSMLTEADDAEVEFELDSPDQFFGSHINLIPLRSAVAGPRLFYGARFYNQALPLQHAEAPLVQSQADRDEAGRSFDEILGKAAGARFARGAGVVRDITPDWIELEGPDGVREQVELYNKLPFNRKTSLTNTPVVKIGDQVQPGQVLARSNFTDNDGRLAMGLNARIGLVPYLGKSMDDAVVVSDSFARRLSSEHLYGYDLDNRNGVKLGKAHYAGVFPGRFVKDQLDKLDDDGVVQPGMVVQPGDPLILATRPRVVSSTSAQLGLLSKHMKNARTNAALLWDHDEPGTVTDVVRLPDGSAKVNVQVIEPTKVGDKIVLRSGQKSFHPDTELLTERGWIKIPDLLQTDRVAALFNDAVGTHAPGPFKKRVRVAQNLVARFVRPLDAHSYHFSGELYGLEAQYAAYLVTGNHRIWRRGHTAGCSHWSCMDAQTIHGESHSFMISAQFDLSDRTEAAEFVIAQAVHGRTGVQMECVCRFPFRTWVRFMAMYLAEGNVRHARPADHTIVITQKEKPFCREIEAVLDGMGLRWKKVNDQYITEPNKALRLYLDQFGKAADKHVPPEIKQAPKDVVQLFLDTIWMCDGDKEEGRRYYTSSTQLASDIQHLLCLVGSSAVIHSREARAHQNHDAHTVQKLDFDTVGTRKTYKKAFFREAYDGPVHCIQVPGVGVVLTRFRGRVMWNGNSIISEILADDQMPRTTDGKPLEVLLNPLGIPSRVNNALVYELLLGKAARRSGKPLKLPSFLPEGQRWDAIVEQHLKDAGLSDTEEVYDPKFGRKLERPVTVGDGYILKLHHTSASKISTRGQGSYTSNEQPAHGGGENAQAKRLSGLESRALLSSGAYNVLREGATLRGQRNDEYWRQLRMGLQPRDPGRPFMFSKFLAMLSGAGYLARKMPKDQYRLQFFTDRDLDELKPMELDNGEIVDIGTFEPVRGGLFDPSLTGRQSWGAIRLPQPMPNPAAEDVIRKLLGLTQKEFRAVLAGEMELPAETLARLKNDQQRA